MLAFFSHKSEHYRDAISSILRDGGWDNQWFFEQCVSFVTSLADLGIRPYAAQAIFSTEFSSKYTEVCIIAKMENGAILASLLKEYRRTAMRVQAQALPEVKPDTLIHEGLIALPVENPYGVDRYDDIPVKYETGKNRAFSPLVPIRFPLHNSNKQEIGMVARHLSDYADLMKSYWDASSAHVYPGVGPIDNAFVSGYIAFSGPELARYSEDILVNSKNIALVRIPGFFQAVPNRDGAFRYPVIAHYPSIASFVSPYEEGLVTASPYLVVSSPDSFDVCTPGRYETLKELVDAIDNVRSLTSSPQFVREGNKEKTTAEEF